MAALLRLGVLLIAHGGSLRAGPREHVRHEAVRQHGRPGGPVTFAARHFSTEADPKRQRQHIFVIGPETSGTRFVSKLLAADLGIPNAKAWDGVFATADAKDAVFHVSLPWGGVCEGQRSEPTLSTWGAQYRNLAANPVPPAAPARFNVDVAKLLDTYAARNESAQVVLVLRDPEVSLRGKMDAHHCGIPSSALAEQGEAFRLLAAAPHSGHVHTVCYEELVASPGPALAAVRRAIGAKAREVHALTSANKKYAAKLPKTYECTDMLRTYVSMCPRTDLARKYSTCR